MEERIKLLTNNCCDNLLRYQKDVELRRQYDFDGFPEESLEKIDFSSNYSIDPSLELSPKPEDDVFGSIQIFEELKDLDRVQANDRRLWVSLTHGQFFRYTKERWSYHMDYSNEAILRRFHFEGASLEARMRNSIARLWWSARITYDENRNDPYELTKLLWSKQDLVQNVVERSYGTYANVVQGILEIYRDNSHLSEGELRSLYTGLNAIGGVKVLSFLSKNEVKEELRVIAKYNEIILN